MKFPHKQLKGVTLIELLVVLMIIAILAGITISIINPTRQQRRAQDATVRSTVGSIAQVIETIYNLRGSYPTALEADRVLVASYMTPGWILTRSNTTCDAAFPGGNCGLRFQHPGITVGRAAGTRILYLVPKTGANTLPCIQATSNENTARYIAWAPGYAITTIGEFCNTPGGWADLLTP